MENKIKIGDRCRRKELTKEEYIHLPKRTHQRMVAFCKSYEEYTENYKKNKDQEFTINNIEYDIDPGNPLPWTHRGYFDKVPKNSKYSNSSEERFCFREEQIELVR